MLSTNNHLSLLVMQHCIKYLTIIVSGFMILLGGCIEDPYEPASPPDDMLDITSVAFLQTRPELFSQLLVALERTQLAETLNDGTYTLVAPKNSGIDKFLAEQYDSAALDAVPVDELTTFLLNHVFESEVTRDMIPLGSENAITVKALSGEEVGFYYINDELLGRFFRIFIDNNEVITSQIGTTSGIVHVLDEDGYIML